MSVDFCCASNHSKAWWLKAFQFLLLTVLWLEWAGFLVCDSFADRCWALSGLCGQLPGWRLLDDLEWPHTHLAIGKWLASELWADAPSPYGPLFSSRLAQTYSLSGLRFPNTVRERKSQQADTDEVSTCIMLAHIPLAKENYVAQHRFMWMRITQWCRCSKRNY